MATKALCIGINQSDCVSDANHRADELTRRGFAVQRRPGVGRG